MHLSMNLFMFGNTGNLVQFISVNVYGLSTGEEGIITGGLGRCNAMLMKKAFQLLIMNNRQISWKIISGLKMIFPCNGQ